MPDRTTTEKWAPLLCAIQRLVRLGSFLCLQLFAWENHKKLPEGWRCGGEHREEWSPGEAGHWDTHSERFQPSAFLSFSTCSQLLSAFSSSNQFSVRAKLVSDIITKPNPCFPFSVCHFLSRLFLHSLFLPYISHFPNDVVTVVKCDVSPPCITLPYLLNELNQMSKW